MKSHILYLIDDRPSEAEEYQELLGAQSGDVEIRILPPPDNKEEVGALIGNEETAGFIIDHRLEEAVPYDGTDLAAYLRAVRKEIPVFMLTSHSADVEAHEHSDAVDNVFSKDLVRNRAPALMKRIERRIGQYDEALSAKVQRLSHLLDLHLAGTIGPEHEQELEELQRELERPVDALLSKLTDQDEAFVEKEQQLVVRLERLVTKLDVDGDRT